MSAHKGDPSRVERVTCAVLLLMSAAVFLFVVLAWASAGRAEASRVVPGAQLADVCVNVRGTQTLLDVTTGHRYRVVAVTPRGNVCRPLVRGQR